MQLGMIGLGRIGASFQALVLHAEHREISDATHMIDGGRSDQFSAELES